MALEYRMEKLEKKLQTMGKDMDSSLLEEADAREESIEAFRNDIEERAYWTTPMITMYMEPKNEEINETWERLLACEKRLTACEERIESYIERGVAGLELEAFEARLKEEMERRMEDIVEQRLAAFSRDIDKHVEEREKDSGGSGADSQGARQRRGRRGGRQGPMARKQQEREEAGEDT